MIAVEFRRNFDLNSGENPIVFFNFYQTAPVHHWVSQTVLDILKVLIDHPDHETAAGRHHVVKRNFDEVRAPSHERRDEI